MDHASTEELYLSNEEVDVVLSGCEDDDWNSRTKINTEIIDCLENSIGTLTAEMFIVADAIKAYNLWMSEDEVAKWKRTLERCFQLQPDHWIE